MKQPEDKKTIDMLEPLKRGRGRPPTGQAMTDAERAKKYRASRKSKGVFVSRTKDDSHDVLGRAWADVLEIDSLKSQIEDLKMQLKGANALLGDYQRDSFPPVLSKRRKAV